MVFSRKNKARSHTLKDLSKFKDYKEVFPGQYLVSKLPLISFSYHYCSAIALIKLEEEKLVGLSHLLPSVDSSQSISNMVKEMGGEPQKLKAIIVTGANPDNIAKYCEEEKIEIVGRYEKEHPPFSSFDYHKVYQRDIILNPFSEQVLIYTKRKGLLFNKKIKVIQQF